METIRLARSGGKQAPVMDGSEGCRARIDIIFRPMDGARWVRKARIQCATPRKTIAPTYQEHGRRIASHAPGPG